MDNFNELIAQATVIRNETGPRENTAVRVGQMFINIINRFAEINEETLAEIKKEFDRAIAAEQELANDIEATNNRTLLFRGLLKYSELDSYNTAEKIGVYYVVDAPNGMNGVATVSFDISSPLHIVQTFLSPVTPKYDNNTNTISSTSPMAAVLTRRFANRSWSQWSAWGGQYIIDNALSDFDITDTKGNVLVRFANGHLRTQNFDSRYVLVVKDQVKSDFDICDQNGNVIVRFEGGHIRTLNFDSRNLGETSFKVVDTAKGQFDLCDQYGNVILRLSNGHIQTKNFDSSNIQTGSGSGGGTTTVIQGYDPRTSFKGKRLAILGDSISSYTGTVPVYADGAKPYGCYYPEGDVNDAAKMWWYRVCDTLGMSFTNCSISGSTVCTDSTHDATGSSPFAGCSNARVRDLGSKGTPDIVICFISCNDWGRPNYQHMLGDWDVASTINTGKSTYNYVREAYAVMLTKIQKYYPFARIFCCSNLDDTLRDEPNTGWPSNNGSAFGKVTTYQWNKSLQEVAESLGATWLDIHGCGINYANLTNFVVDGGLHPNAAGHRKIADFITKQLISNY